ncbi:ATP-binding protein [Marinibactrum halimedae]|uniref:ATPase n=1 Tax=Marinibactrum halimedae TaxID=1444977 RepID=A0AA37WNA9_9GAMM|nr:AAA family ATPase [Marinibactrum halimedae]MCD9460790.1 AAA family ATPase [Marinibactrum halimedae]GLS27378.1 ATPase [Marinibactrum halimedae]
MAMHQQHKQNNYQALLAEIAEIKPMLRRHLAGANVLTDEVSQQACNSQLTRLTAMVAPAQDCIQGKNPDLQVTEQNQRPDLALVQETVSENTSKLALETGSVMLNRLCTLFELSQFDRQLLLLCIGAELDPEISSLCEQLIGQSLPNLALALRCFSGHCAALSHEQPLVYFKLLEINSSHYSLLQRSLSLSQWTLFYITGEPVIDQQLMKVIQPIYAEAPRLSGDDIVALKLSETRRDTPYGERALQLIACSDERAYQVAALFAAHQQRDIYVWNLHHLPTNTEEQNAYLQVLEREIIARQCLMLIDCQSYMDDEKNRFDEFSVKHWLERLFSELPGSCLMYASKPLELLQLPVQHHEIDELNVEEQQQVWQYHLQDTLLETPQEVASVLPEQFKLTSRQIRDIASQASLASSSSETKTRLWQYSREQLRQDLQGLAHVYSPSYVGWDNLVLPKQEKQNLQAIVAQAQQRHKVCRQWGFAEHLSYGLGMAALFAGSSGTGKTLAARTIASCLHLDLYQVDLSSIADKYIGETEKKLDKIFRAAENSGAVLLFDEADALFGKRTQVQDSKDRYANMSVSYLLQRLESYNGLSILTTNLRAAIDPAFTRRLGFIVQFSFPGKEERMEIWRRSLPEKTPTKDIDFEKLARISLSGGAIRNVMLQAAFMAAESEQPITMGLLREAVEQEFFKTEKTLNENLVSDW